MAADRLELDDASDSPMINRATVATLGKAFSILGAVGEAGATAREISERLGFPLPTVYRLVKTLVGYDYLVHVKDEQRYELGRMLDGWGGPSHRRSDAPHFVREKVTRLRDEAGMASYFSVHRGSSVAVAWIADSESHPCSAPHVVGLNEAAHATAVGRILLAEMSNQQLDEHFAWCPPIALTRSTPTRRSEIAARLECVRSAGIAWEEGEFVPTVTAAAVGVRDRFGNLIGSVSATAATTSLAPEDRRRLERCLRQSARSLSLAFARPGNRAA